MTCCAMRRASSHTDTLILSTAGISMYYNHRPHKYLLNSKYLLNTILFESDKWAGIYQLLCHLLDIQDCIAESRSFLFFFSKAHKPASVNIYSMKHTSVVAIVDKLYLYCHFLVLKRQQARSHFPYECELLLNRFQEVMFLHWVLSKKCYCPYCLWLPMLM